MKKKRTTAERYVRLTHRMMQTKAWKSLDGNARAVYIALAMIYQGTNNGRIGFSARQAAQALPISRVTAFRSLVALQDRGFIVAMITGRFDRKRHATRWRLTEFRCDVTSQPASRDFDAWTTADILTLRLRGESAERGTDG
jgi:hypothetical protein